MSSGHLAPPSPLSTLSLARLRAATGHARRVTPLQWGISLTLAALVLLGLLTPLTLGGQGRAQASVTLRSGVYCDGLKAACTDTFATWRGQPVRSTLTFFPDSTWSDIEGPDWWYQGWLSNPYRSVAVVTIPMLPAKGTSADPTPTLEEGAAGDYDAYWKVVAQRLVANDMAGVTIRPGHELNGSWYRWAAQKDPAAYAGYFRQIVTTMRSVPGANFSFDWNVAVGGDSWDATAAWPGDAYVDTVGQDVYDVKWGDSSASPQTRWNALLNGGKFHEGLQFWANFAAAHGKPISFAEWALVAAGASMANGGEGKDDPYFIQQMHTWFVTHPTAFEIYFDRTATDGDHVLNGGKFPQSATVYRQLFSSSSTVSLPSSSSSAVSSSAGSSSSAAASGSAASSDPASSDPVSSDPASSDPASDPAASGSSTDPTPAGSTPADSTSAGAPSPAPSSVGATTASAPVSHRVLLRVSGKADRAGARPLWGRTLHGNSYVFATAPSAREVAFYLDDVHRRHRPMRLVSSAPFDLQGTSEGLGRPWRTWRLTTGTHTLTAVVWLRDGSTVVRTARFHVIGRVAPAYRTVLAVTRFDTRTHAHRLAGTVVSGEEYVYLSARRPSSVASVSFYLDDPHRRSPAVRRDSRRPFDLVGSSGGKALGLDTGLMRTGWHSLMCVIHWKDGTVTTHLVRFRVVR